MKEEDLMIGDFVKMNAGPARITAIKEGEIHFVDRFGRGISPDCEGLPLTSEILEKNGFKRSEVFVEWKYENDNVYMIYKPFLYLKIQMEEYIVAFPCEYIHELQHALRLCGISKDITL